MTAAATYFALNRPRPLDTSNAPEFNAPAYALDLLFPILDLGQEKSFTPTGAAQWIAYLITAVGWILAGTVAAGITRTITRN